MDRILKTALCSLLFNVAFSAYHILSGILARSWWLFTVGVYYAILSAVRFVVIVTKKRDRLITGFTGTMLMALSLPLLGTVILALTEERGRAMHEIVMIAMAAYAFTKITLAVVNLIRSRKSRLAKHVAVRNISLADACVSIFSLQRSMLVSFGDMSERDILLFNAFLGSAVCLAVFSLGLNLLQSIKRLGQ